MAVKMRLTRLGDKKAPFYRIVVCDARVARSGEYIEKIGDYNPLTNPATVNINAELAKAWLAKGVQPTDTVRNLLIKAGVIERKNVLTHRTGKTKKEEK